MSTPLRPEAIAAIRKVADTLAKPELVEHGTLPLAMLLRSVADEAETGVRLWGMSESTFPITRP